MGDAKYLDLIAKYLSGNINQTERADLLAWATASEANKLFFDEMIQLWSISADYEEDFETDVDAAWNKLDQQLLIKEKPETVKPKEAKIVSIKPFRWVARVAAVLLVLAAGYWWLSGTEGILGNQMMAIESKDSTRLEHQLPDGSIVWLNEYTSLSYKKSFKERIVYLEGEAFFEVERMEENPFIIHSGDAKTTVLGTSFNVRAYPDEDQVEVTVETGLVRFEEQMEEEKEIMLQEEKDIMLEAGHTGLYIKESNEVKKIEKKDPNAIAWKTRRLVFDNEKLGEVVKAMERYYKIDILVSNQKVLNCTLNANMMENPKLEDVVEIVAYIMELDIVPTQDGYVMKGGKVCD